jgi:DNA processing protein
MDAARARAVLARTPSLEPAQLQALLAAADGDLVRALEPRQVRSAQLPEHVRRHLLAPDAAALEADAAWLIASDTRILLCTDADYPPLLHEAVSTPTVLYVQGSVAALNAPQLAMVGSPHPTHEGRATARAFAAWFARAGLTVTSGLSEGIDAACHLGALDAQGETVAVCGSALDQVYPEEHAALAARIRAHGALVSEVPPRTRPRREHFVRRNRITAGLALGTLVIEASRVSGALVTARLAASAGREVFAIPGSIHSPLARGPHQLIKSGAKLVEEAADVLAELKISVPKEQLTPPPEVLENPPALDKEYEMLLDALGFEPATIDVLVARTRLARESVASMLLILELEGRVATLPGGRYGRIP